MRSLAASLCVAALSQVGFAFRTATDSAEITRDGVHDSPYVNIEERPVNFNCCQEVGIDQELRPDLPDLAETAHTWCNSDRVPAEKRVPPFLRGLYWLKGYGDFSAIAFCTSLAQWDPETNTALLAPWMSWVNQRLWDDAVPPGSFYDFAGVAVPEKDPVTGMAHNYDASATPLGKTDVYELSFDVSNPDEIKADIQFTSSENTWMNWITTLPLNELESTADGAVHRERSGDIWDRPSYLLGLVNVHQYQPVRIVDDDGVIHRERYDLMKQSYLYKNSSFVYCNWEC